MTNKKSLSELQIRIAPALKERFEQKIKAKNYNNMSEVLRAFIIQFCEDN